MKNFSEWSSARPRERVVAFDLDDTLTEHGTLPARVIQGLEAAQAKGWLTVLVTGRPAGWADALVKLLPWDAVVAENGAVLYFWKSRKRGRSAGEEPVRRFWAPTGYVSTRPAADAAWQEPLWREVQGKFPRVRTASDQPFRMYDLAIDFAEEVQPPHTLPEAEAIARVATAQGLTAKVSSIHVNVWRGSFTKADGLRQTLTNFGFTPEEHVVYVGDSPNDGPLFAVASVSVGVANLKAFDGPEFKFQRPGYLTAAPCSAGALEVLGALPALAAAP